MYDREINSILLVDESEFSAFQRIEKGKDNEDDWKLLKRYTEHGYLKESSLEEIVHPSTPLLGFYLSKQVTQLTMQVTQNCNLACAYCAYSGNYDHQRTHMNKKMSLDMMKKCADFLMGHSSNVSEVTLAFYGGEPLLEIENIKACVDYVEEKYTGRQVSYTLTTNGTLLTDEAIRFLKEKEFNLAISLDGPKDLHDRHRIFRDGRGSFDIIMQNLEHIKDSHPEFFEKINILSTVAPDADFACVHNFFNANEVLSDKKILQNTVNTFSTKDEITYEDLYVNTYKFENLKVLLAALGCYSKDKTSNLFASNLVAAEKLHGGIARIGIVKACHPSGPCVPSMRTFINADGFIYPCERVGEQSEAVKIGHIDTGFDVKKAEAVLNIGRITEEECKTCWSFLNCGLCVAACEGEKEFSRERRLKNCALTKRNTEDTLRTVCLLLENGYDFELEATPKRKG